MAERLFTLNPNFEFRPPAQGEIYEHLFPENQWDTLPHLNATGLPKNMQAVFWGRLMQHGAYIEAANARKGFASRIDFAHPDQATLFLLLYGMQKSEDSTNAARVSHLYDRQKEILGGVAHLQYDKSWSNGSEEPDIEEGSIIGVQDRFTRTPHGIILMRPYGTILRTPN
ncbi:MAG: hypothetical protein ACEQSA_04750 [Weeksellaceae bacterium]